MAQLDTTPIPSAPDRPPLNRNMATVAVVQAMYRESYWPALAQSLAAAQGGDGAGLLQFFDMYYQRSQDGTWGNELEAFRVIDCMDQTLRQTVAEVDAETPAFHDAAPRLVPADSAGGYACGVPAAARGSPGRGHGGRCRPGRGDRHDRRPVDAVRLDAQRWPTSSRTGGWWW